MAETNRVSISKDLIEPLRDEARNLLLTDDLTATVNWVLRRYFRDRAEAGSSTTKQGGKAQSLTNYDDLFAK